MSAPQPPVGQPDEPSASGGSPAASAPITATPGKPLRLHIGGEDVKDGWKIVNIQPKPGVDFIGSATDLSAFADGAVEEIYGSHIYEHLDYVGELPRALDEAYRVLKPGGLFRAGVPDLEVLCQLLLHKDLTPPERFHVQRMMFGGHVDRFDFHYVGYTFEFLAAFLWQAGFRSIRRVDSFGLFDDTTDTKFMGVRISLNVMAMKPVERGSGGEAHIPGAAVRPWWWPPGLPWPISSG